MAKRHKICKMVRKEGVTLCLAALSFFISVYLLFKDYNYSVDVRGLELQDWTSIIQLIIVLASAIIAVITIISARKTSKERATLDVVLGDYKDGELVEASRLIFDLVRRGSNELYNVFQNKDGQNTEERLCLLLVLNRYEFYASAMNHGILDEKLFKRLHCANFIKLWDAVSPTVTSIRHEERKETIFKDLELLVLRWKANPLTIDDL